MSDALEEHDGKVSLGGRNITNLRFADDIDALAKEKQELEALVENLYKTCTRDKMEMCAEKTKLMTNSANGIQRERNVKGQKLGKVFWFSKDNPTGQRKKKMRQTEEEGGRQYQRVDRNGLCQLN